MEGVEECVTCAERYLNQDGLVVFTVQIVSDWKLAQVAMKYFDRVPFSMSPLIVSTMPPSPLNINNVCFFPLFAPTSNMSLANSVTDSAELVLVTVYTSSANPRPRNRGCNISSKKAGARPMPERVEIRTWSAFPGCRYSGSSRIAYSSRKDLGRVVAVVVWSLIERPLGCDSVVVEQRLKMVRALPPMPSASTTVITSLAWSCCDLEESTSCSNVKLVDVELTPPSTRERGLVSPVKGGLLALMVGLESISS